MDSQETKVYVAILIGAAVLGIILVYFIITMIRQQRSNYALHLSKIEAEINTLEKERKRMAFDLHDELGPVLLSIRYHVNSLDIHSDADQRTLEKTNAIVDNTINRFREISNDLLPEALLRKGLITALEESTGDVQLKTGLVVELQHNLFPTLPVAKAISLYRIIQEIIHNTIKHAHAKKLTIDLRKEENTLYVYTQDDGEGFDYDAEQSAYTGLGLRSILSRAEMLGGTMYLESKAGIGTRYIVEIPYNHI